MQQSWGVQIWSHIPSILEIHLPYANLQPFALHSKMEQLIEDMLDQGVIQHSSSLWASPIVLVKKKDGSHRFCVDYRRLNSGTRMDVFPFPRVDDTLDMLSQTQFFPHWILQPDIGRSGWIRPLRRRLLLILIQVIMSFV